MCGARAPRRDGGIGRSMRQRERSRCREEARSRSASGERMTEDGERCAMPISMSIESPPPSKAASSKRKKVVKHIVDTHNEGRARGLLHSVHEGAARCARAGGAGCTEKSTGQRVGIAYDIGHLTERFIRNFADVRRAGARVEPRFAAMLRTGPYPWSVKQRVAGPNGHLSNAESSADGARVRASRAAARGAVSPEPGQQPAGDRPAGDALRHSRRRLPGHVAGRAAAQHFDARWRDADGAGACSRPGRGQRTAR